MGDVRTSVLLQVNNMRLQLPLTRFCPAIAICPFGVIVSCPVQAPSCYCIFLNTITNIVSPEEGTTKCVCNDWKKLHPRNNQSCVPAEDYLLVLERQEMLNISVDTDPTFKTTLPFKKVGELGLV